MSAGTLHSVIGLGTDGGQELADGDRLGRGVYLRWPLAPELGFPIGGFHVSRRSQRSVEWICLSADEGLMPPDGGVTSWESLGFEFGLDRGGAMLDLQQCPPSGAVHLPGQRALRIRPPQPMAAVRASGAGAPPLIELFASEGGDLRLVARRRAARRDDGWTVTVWADGTIACRLSGTDMRICEVCFGLADVTGGWRRLHEDPILAPVVTEGTANSAANLHDADATRGVAYERLATTLGRDARGALAEAFATGGLGEVVEDLVRGGRHTLLPPDATDAAGARTPPQLGMAAAQLVTLTALDPDVARMLGLLYHDAVESGTYDYKVVAHHGDVRPPSRLVTFDSAPAGPLDPTATFAGVTFVGTAGLEVLPADRDQRAALRVAAPRMGTAAGIRFEPPVPAVSVRLAGIAAVPVAAWRGSLQVDAGLTFSGAATLEDGGGIDAVTWSTGPVDLVEIEIYEGAGFVGDLTAYAWRLSPTAPAPVHDLDLTEAAAAAEPARLQPDGTVDAATGVVGLDWQASSPLHDAGRPVRAHAGRAATVTDPLEVRNADQPAPAFADPRGRSDAGPDVPQRWFERGIPPGPTAWSVRGIDVFGRLGEWAAARAVNVPAGTVPPPPDRVEAEYLDPADPLLDDEQRALVERDGPGLLVHWTWPAERRVAAPGVEPEGEFRVYVRRGDPNVLEGAVHSVTDLGDRSRLATDLTLRGSLAGERLRVGGTSFPVVASTTGDDAAIEVAHLTAPVARPSAGAFTVHLSEGSPLRTDLLLARGFGERVHVKPVGSPPRLTARIVMVTAAGSVTLDQPLPAADGLPGRLVTGGIAYRVVGQSPGSARVDVASAPQPDGSTALPAAGERCTVWCGAAYRAWLPGVGATPRPDERLALTLVAVSACDLDAVVLHEPVPPGPRAAPRRGDGGPGLEGPLSRIARVSVPHRDPPPIVPVDRPQQDGDIPADRAEPADWYGQARYDLEFARVPGATGYRVGRASVASLCETDRGARQAAAAPYEDGPFDDAGASEAWLAEHHPPVAVADLTAATLSPAALAAWRDWSAWFYPQRLNRELMALAELPCNEEALRPAHANTIAAPPFADVLDGRGLGRFVYRLRSVDASGNASAWSAAFPLVEVQDVTPPATPSLTAVLSAQDAVVVSWRANREADLAGYRIWRADSAAELDDVRRRAVHAELAATAGTVTETWTDALPAQLGARFYRLAAFDAAGNVSAPTAAVAGRPIDTIAPNPTAWLRAGRSGPGTVMLAWEGDEDGLRCQLERRADRARVWAPLTGWLTPDVRGGRRFRHVDADADPAVRWRYRVRARDAAGNIGPGLVEIVVDAQDGG